MNNDQKRLFSGFSEATFRFFFELGLNNNREWFLAHKRDYEEKVLQPLRDWVSDMLPLMLKIDPRLEIPAKPDKIIARIYRDLRFAKDKTPYRTNLWVTFKRPVEDWKVTPAFFADFSYEGYQYGMGYYTVTPELRREIKDFIRQYPQEWERVDYLVRKSPCFRLAGERYKRPLDKTLSDGERDWCERKSLYLVCEKGLADSVFSSALVDEVYGSFREIQPVYEFFRAVRKNV